MNMKCCKILATIIILFLTSCGGGTSSTSVGGGFDSGLERSRLLLSLSNSEAQMLCDQSKEFLANDLTDENICKVAAPGLNPDPKECSSQLQSCLNDTSSTIESEIFGINCNTGSTAGLKCSANIEVFENCLDEIVWSFNDLLARSDCGNTDAGYLNEFNNLFVALPQTPGCIELAAKCPNLL